MKPALLIVAWSTAFVVTFFAFALAIEPKPEPLWIEYELPAYSIHEPTVFQPSYYYDPDFYGEPCELFNPQRYGVYDLHEEVRWVWGEAMRIGKGEYQIVTMKVGKIPRWQPNL